MSSEPKRPLTVFSRNFRLPWEKMIALVMGPSVYALCFALGIVGSLRGAPTLDATFHDTPFVWFGFVFTVWQWSMAAVALVAYYIDRSWARVTEIFFCAGLLGQLVFYDGLLIVRVIVTNNEATMDASYPAVYSIFGIVALVTRLLFAFNEATILRIIGDARRRTES